ncbi:MAG: CopG family transcriptional regulator [Chloroflexota bacterium]
MSSLNKRTTIYLDPQIHQALRLKSVETHRTISDLINEMIREQLAEDAEDLQAFNERANEPLISYEALLQALQKDGKL